MWFIWESVLNLPSIISLVIGGILFYFWFKRPCSHFPPGPRGFPILGCIPFLGLTPEVKFLEYAKTYGNIFSVRIGRQEWVVLNDSEAIHEAFLKRGSYTSNRPSSMFLQKFSDFVGVVTVNYDAVYKSQKHFGLSTLRGFGVGKKSMEDRVTDEFNYLSEDIRSYKEKPFDIRSILSMAICNNIAAVIFGSRFEYDDPMFIEIIRIIFDTVSASKVASTLKIVNLCPMLEHIPPFHGTIQQIIKEIKKQLVLFKQLVEEHKQTFDKNNLRDFTDAFILKIEENKDLNFTDLQLLQYIRELFGAGTETSTSTLLWGILCLLHYPQTENKIYKEIINIVGAEGKVTYADKDKMHYTSAFIEELFRYRTLSPLGLPHATSSDVTIKGFCLPKGTAILINIWGAHNSPKDWNEPEKFMPKRHLNEKEEFVKSPNVIPFGIGPRACLGEQLGRMEVFIYFVSLVQKFHFEPDPTNAFLPEINKSNQGIVFAPLPFKLIFKER